MQVPLNSQMPLAFLDFLGYNQEKPYRRSFTMENENLLNEEEVSILTLTDENGEEINFEYLDCIEYQGVEYLVLAPEGDEEGETVILEVQPVDEENENYVGVEDEAILNAVFGIFKEKYKDILQFEE